jgi:hypothetical protein
MPWEQFFRLWADFISDYMSGIAELKKNSEVLKYMMA